MEPCGACRTLVGKPSSAPPHPDLSEAGADIAGAAAHPVKRCDRYRCTVCGKWLLRNTAASEAGAVWSFGAPSRDARAGDAGGA